MTKSFLLDQKFSFWPKVFLLTKSFLFDHNLDFWSNFLARILIFFKRLLIIFAKDNLRVKFCQKCYVYHFCNNVDNYYVILYNKPFLFKCSCLRVPKNWQLFRHNKNVEKIKIIIFFSKIWQKNVCFVRLMSYC